MSQTLGGLQTDKFSYGGPISGNGRFIAYATKATNMGAADTNNDIDSYVYDVQTDTTTLVSHDPDGIAVGGTPTGISDNGKVVSFSSESDALDPKDTDTYSGAFVYNAGNDTVKLVSLPSTEWPGGVIAFSSGVSANGRYVSYDAIPQTTPRIGRVPLRPADEADREDLSDARWCGRRRGEWQLESEPFGELHRLLLGSDNSCPGGHPRQCRHLPVAPYGGVERCATNLSRRSRNERSCFDVGWSGPSGPLNITVQSGLRNGRED